jgi:hypothetical protein
MNLAAFDLQSQTENPLKRLPDNLAGFLTALVGRDESKPTLAARNIYNIFYNSGMLPFCCNMVSLQSEDARRGNTQAEEAIRCHIAERESEYCSENG